MELYLKTNITRKNKNNARIMYRHECEPVNPILIMLPMMHEVGSGGITLNFSLGGDGGLFVIKFYFVWDQAGEVLDGILGVIFS